MHEPWPPGRRRYAYQFQQARPTFCLNLLGHETNSLGIVETFPHVFTWMRRASQHIQVLPLDEKFCERPAKPRLLDLFCCAGGASVGYVRAGFDVVGVDLHAQPNYPYEFIQADALTLDPEFLASFDAIHASPPCQSYSDLAKRNANAHKWPRLVEPVREMLQRTGKPWVIENVDGAPLIAPIVLCGTMFPELRVLRHRLFEANFPLIARAHKKHPKVHTFDKRKSHFGKTDEWKDFVQVTGGGNCTLAAARDAMGIDWMTKGEINEAIPPAYAEFVGRQLIAHLDALNAAEPMLLTA